MGRTFSNLSEKFSWQDFALIFLIILFTIIFISHANSYKEIPSPVFGGDFFRDRGFVQNIVAGGSIWSDGFYVNEINYYGYLFPAIEAGVVLLFGFTVNQVFIYFPIILLIVSMITWYLLGKLFFKDKTWALLCVVSFMTTLFEYTMKTGFFAFFTFVPLFFYFWIKFEIDGKKLDAIFAGLILGLMPLIYGGTFVALTIIIASYIIFNFIKRIVHSHKAKELNMKNFTNLIIEFLKKYWLLTLVAVVFALIYFGPLIVKYNLHVVNNVPKWGDPKVELTGLSWMWAQIRYFLINTKSMPFMLVSLTSLVGFITLFFTKKTPEKKILIFAIIANVITVQHQVITYPLFGIYLWSVKLFTVPFLLPLLFVFGAKFISHMIEKKTKKAPVQSENKLDDEISIGNVDTKKIVFAVFCILLALVFVARFNEFKASQWVQVGMQDSPYMDSLYGLSDYIRANVGADETILSNDESGFMLAVLSGRKVMLTRRTHASYYVDIDQRIADAAVAMYGPDLEKSKQILKKYNVKYLYIDQNFAQYPMRTNTGFKKYLADNNVEFSEVHDRYDIALLPQDATLMDILLINPQNATRFMSLFEPVYTPAVQGQAIGQLLKLKE